MIKLSFKTVQNKFNQTGSLNDVFSFSRQSFWNLKALVNTLPFTWEVFTIHYGNVHWRLDRQVSPKCQCSRCLYKNYSHIFSLVVENHNFGVLGLMFIIHDLQCQAKALRQFCSPAFDCDSIIKSSAYKRELDLVPVGKTKGSDKMFSKE